jgi:hypothetical protein
VRNSQVNALLVEAFGQGAARAAGLPEPDMDCVRRGRKAAGTKLGVPREYTNHRRCTDCGRPTYNYRCEPCWRRRRGYSCKEDSDDIGL